MEYGINKGIGKSVEFRGLNAQYLFIFAGGLLAVFVVFVILYMAGVDQWVCIAFGVAAASVLVWLTFRLNARYGEHGLMKLFAAHRHPRYLLNRKSLRRWRKRKGGRGGETAGKPPRWKASSRSWPWKAVVSSARTRT